MGFNAVLVTIGQQPNLRFAAVLVSFSFALLVRACISLGPHSGLGKPPMYGDFEAQRHWMEITANLDSEQWYVNGTDNDLLYWGLDYPPLTAYHAKLCASVGTWLGHPEWFALHSSRGSEGPALRLFMRYTVLVADVLIFLPAVLFFYWISLRLKSANGTPYPWQSRFAGVVFLMLQPGLILIDHGHFQYNGISLGFALAAVAAVCVHQDVAGAILFTLSLNYKQMSLYLALPFFFYLLGKCLQPFNLIRLVRIGVAVICTFFVCWWPFLSIEGVSQVLTRLFPFNRGLFEDKVANLWCVVSVVVKIREFLSQESQIRISFISTLLAVTPSSLNLLRFPHDRRFRYALSVSALAFFLFSYQVHEKSILLACLPISLLFVEEPIASVHFAVVSTFSLYPLLLKDGQAIQYFTMMVLLVGISISFARRQEQPSVITSLLLGLSALSMLGVHLASFYIPAPARYPDIHTLSFAAVSCVHFVFYYGYFTVRQLQFKSLFVKAKQG